MTSSMAMIMGVGVVMDAVSWRSGTWVAGPGDGDRDGATGGIGDPPLFACAVDVVFGGGMGSGDMRLCVCGGDVCASTERGCIGEATRSSVSVSRRTGDAVGGVRLAGGDGESVSGSSRFTPKPSLSSSLMRLRLTPMMSSTARFAAAARYALSSSKMRLSRDTATALPVLCAFAALSASLWRVFVVLQHRRRGCVLACAGRSGVMRWTQQHTSVHERETMLATKRLPHTCAE